MVLSNYCIHIPSLNEFYFPCKIGLVLVGSARTGRMAEIFRNGANQILHKKYLFGTIDTNYAPYKAMELDTVLYF